jgi:hypothetical protein
MAVKRGKIAIKPNYVPCKGSGESLMLGFA